MESCVAFRTESGVPRRPGIVSNTGDTHKCDGCSNASECWRSSVTSVSEGRRDQLLGAPGGKCVTPDEGGSCCYCCQPPGVRWLTTDWRSWIPVEVRGPLLTVLMLLVVSLFLEGYVSEAVVFKYVFQM